MKLVFEDRHQQHSDSDHRHLRREPVVAHGLPVDPDELNAVKYSPVSQYNSISELNMSLCGSRVSLLYLCTTQWLLQIVSQNLHRTWSKNSLTLRS